MDLQDLKSKINSQVKLILLSHPHNPVGRVWTSGELTELANICVENNIIILSDEIHSDLVFAPHRHIPLSTLSDEISRMTLSFVAPSKTFNIAGLASSVVIAENEELRDKFRHEINSGHLGMGNIFGTVALESAYLHGDEWLNQLMGYLQENINILMEYMESRLPGVSMSRPEATYLAWLDMRELGMRGKDLRQFMIHKARIGCNDGPSFGQGGEGFQRLNFACPRPTLQKALNQLEVAINTHMKDLL